MYRKIIITISGVFLVLVLAIFSSCAKEEANVTKDSQGEETEEEPGFRVIELEEKVPPGYAESEWSVISEKEYLESSVLIFKGKVLDKKEYVIEQKVSYKFTQKFYKTVYQFEISDIYYSDEELKVGDTVKIMSPVTSHNWTHEAISMEKGQEFILFAGLVRDIETYVGKIETTDLAKYFIGNPWEPIISVDNGTYKMDPLFESLTNNSTVEKREVTDSYSMNILVRKDEDFIPDLMEMIDKYKK